MFHRPSSPLTRLARTGLVCLTSFTLVFGGWMEIAQAQIPPANAPGTGAGGGIPTAITANVPELLNTTYQTVTGFLSSAAMMALFNAAQLFFGNLAYDAAVYIVSGGKGQGSMFYKQSFGKYMEDAAKDAAGEFIGTLSDSSFLKGLGINLCAPSNPLTLLKMQLSINAGINLNDLPGATGRFARQKPRCDFQTIVNNYDNLYQTMSNYDVLSNISANFNLSSNDLGFAAKVNDSLNYNISKKISDLASQRIEGAGVKAVTNMITGNVKTPSAVVQAQINEAMVRQPNAAQNTMTGAIFGQALKMGAIQLVIYTASVFLNTLVSQGLKMLMESGLDSIDLSGVSLGPDAVLTGSQTDTRKANISLREPKLVTDSEVETLSDLIACPDPGRGLFNCAVDQSLAQAIRGQTETGQMTIKEALDRKFLHGDWRLIPSSIVKENQDPLCYTRAYCAGNLQKLRLMRIFPVGFEFAADSQQNVDRCSDINGCVTLKEVVDGFTKCEPNGTWSEKYPWCHLIDPNWIITLPGQRCALKGYGNNLLTKGLNQRQQECSDIQTCLKRNDKGDCVGGYGYCLAEKTVYRFQADECPSQYASCRVYTARDTTQVSYLRNTLDRGVCSADNVGCLWYATTRDPSNNESTNWVGTTSTGPRLYFDKTLETCSANQEGCTKVFVTATTTGERSLNFLLNPSFERLKMVTNDAGDSTSTLVGWLPDNRPFAPATVAAGPAAFDGSASYLADGTALTDTANAVSQRVTLAPSRVYTISYYTRQRLIGGSAPSAVANAIITQYKDDSFSPDMRLTAREVGTAYRSFGCLTTPNSPAYNAITNPYGIDTTTHLPGWADGSQVAAAKVMGMSQDWSRVECSFLTSTSTRAATIVFTGMNALIDAAQLEEAEFASDFTDGINPQLPPTYLKIPPDEFNCQGKPTDHPYCSQFARVCTQPEAGCQGYTETSGNLGEVPAIISKADQCPAKCVGYSEYRKRASSFDLVHEVNPLYDDPTDSTSTYFIPSTAAACTQQAVGCEAFTNVAAAGAGGEAASYFTYVRSCELPGDDTQTYFTWEGSDTAGYQLKTWSLKKRTPEKPGQEPTEGASVFNGPRILLKRTADLLMAKAPATCNADTWNAKVDADCRQFYDPSGAIYYRYFTQTILSTPDCGTYRIGITSQTDCQKTGGTYNTVNGDCRYNIYTPDSQTCTAAQVGCRAYAGAEAGNIQTIISESFRTATGTFIGGRRSSEALLVGDQSLRLDVTSPAANGRVSTAFPSSSDQLFRVTFWAKAPGAGTTVSLATSNPDHPSETPVAVGNINVTSDWQQFSVGLFNGSNGVTTTLAWVVPGPRTGSLAFFLDEVRVQKMQDMVFAVRDSWTTPGECDQSSTGLPEPQGMLGCRQYRNRNGEILDLRRFTRLCREESIGCRGFVDTRDSTDIGAQTFVMKDEPPIEGYGAATTTRPADRMLYLVDDAPAHCSQDAASCRAFGKPVTRPDRQEIASFETVYYKDDITKYGDALCRPSELYCEEYTFGESAKDYFKDPQTHVCEYREQVSIAAGEVAGIPEGTYSGWFQTGLKEPCYPQALESGSFFNILRVGDTTGTRGGYQGWGGLCPADMGECTEFRDPNDTSDILHPSGKPYFFVRNDNLDVKSCAGNIDVGRGCILLNDLSDTVRTYNVAATYAKYAHNLFKPTAPINCVQDPGSPYCQAKGQCRGSVHRIARFQSSEPAPEGPDELFSLGASGLTGVDTSVTTKHFKDNKIERDTVSAWLGPTCTSDADCQLPAETSLDFITVTNTRVTPNIVQRLPIQETRYDGTCQRETEVMGNDANLIVKVKTDRDCAQWLGCAAAETVFDRSLGRYKDICTTLSVCDQPSNRAGDLFCANYTDRSTAEKEPILTEGAYFDISRYVGRAVGIGVKDYSGYSIPNAFQITDLKSVRVATDGIQPAGVLDDPSKFANDYRLAAAIRMPPATCAPGAKGRIECTLPLRPMLPNEARLLDPSDPRVPTSTGFRLCEHIGTGRIGFYVLKDAQANLPFYCYLPVHANSDAYDFENISAKFNIVDPDSDSTIKLAFPAPECRVQPEADAPYPASYVKHWDMTANPPKPQDKLFGYTAANTCEYGEDCACAYKRVSYSQSPTTKFYGLYSQSVPPGICQGGPRDGSLCNPEAMVRQATSTKAGNNATAAGLSNLAMTCGTADTGATCAALETIDLVRGVFGQCLERDVTRGTGDDVSAHPCLTWNPTPILFGDKDPYHFVPTSGYLPPQNSGQYYCASKARTSKTGNFGQDWFLLNQSQAWTGQLDGNDPWDHQGHHRLYYIDDDVSYGKTTPSEGGDGQDIDGTKMDSSGGTQQDCEDVDHNETTGGMSDSDFSALKMITVGRNHTYNEYFFKVNPSSVAKYLNNLPANATPSVDVQANALLEENFGYFAFEPISAAHGGYNSSRWACGYTPNWVPDMTRPDLNDWDAVKRAEPEFMSKLYLNYNKILARDTEQVYKAPGTTDIPQPVTCVNSGGLKVTDKCYMKTWETVNQMNDQRFVGLKDPDTSHSAQASSRGVAEGMEELWNTPYFADCTNDKAGFAIRAVFQTNADPHKQGFPMYDPGHGPPDSRTKTSNVRGPWQFVGFWISACGGPRKDNEWMYMYVTTQSADICRELAEVQSRDTKQDAAYTDRTWADGAYTAPVIGTTYATRYSPFSSALNTKPADTKGAILFQSGGIMAGYSALNPPAFIASGYDTYYRSTSPPKDKYAYLSNLFARIYRIYHYYDSVVSKDSSVCIAGENKGNLCTPDAVGGATPTQGTSKDCVVTEHCQAAADTPDMRVCNSLSGVNAGLPCDDNPDKCHTGIINPTSGNLLTGDPYFGACNASANWNKIPDSDPHTNLIGEWYNNTDDSWWSGDSPPCPSRSAPPDGTICNDRILYHGHPIITEAQAIQASVFLCASDTITSGVRCTQPLVAHSTDCPYPINPGGTGGTAGHGTCVPSSPGSATGTCSIILPGGAGPILLDASKYPPCLSSNDCSFTRANYWLSRRPESGGNIDSNRPLPTLLGIANPLGKTVRITYVTDPFTNCMGAPLNTDQWCRKITDVEIQRYPQADTTVGLYGVDLGVAGHIGADYITATIGGCESLKTMGAKSGYNVGVCVGGSTDGRLCMRNPGRGDARAYGGNQCVIPPVRVGIDDQCYPVSRKDGSHYYPTHTTVGGTETFDCRTEAEKNLPDVETTENDSDKDNNICTHGQGYRPRPDLCPDPGDEFCGLIAYRINDNRVGGSLDQTQNYPLPTDVTLGHYTPDFLGLRTPSPTSAEYASYIAYYTPMPPRIAALDARTCPSAGQCAVTRFDAFTFNGQAEGSMSAAGGQLHSTIQFYGWAAHNQMPIRQLIVDWGDGFQQSFPDARIKNHKPFCGAMKECYIEGTGLFTGLTCNTDSDCPAGSGKCETLGTCSKRSNVTCRKDSDCTDSSGATDTCQSRVFFGNSPDACDSNFFSFDHLYTCNANASSTLPSCNGNNVGATTPVPSDVTAGRCFFGTMDPVLRAQWAAQGITRPSCPATDCTRYFLGFTGLKRVPIGLTISCGPPALSVPPVAGHCSRDPGRYCGGSRPEDIGCAPGDTCVTNESQPSGCWDAVMRSCRYTPRVYIQDNWGWCTGECRTDMVGGTLQDAAGAHVRHKFGGCWSGEALGNTENDPNVKGNTPDSITGQLFPVITPSECGLSLPSQNYRFARPWIVYPGSLQLRARQ